MGIQHQEVSKHWNYFLMLEDDLASVARYVEFHQDNYKTYSLELSRLLVTACGEVDGILKQVCKLVAPKRSGAWNIDSYREVFSKEFADFPKSRVAIPRYGLELTPWENWGTQQPTSPLWWVGHNGIKHSRHTEFQNGNLKNVLNAMAGLYIANIFLHSLGNPPQLLIPNPALYFPISYYNGETHVGGSNPVIAYDITHGS